jgi:hypothetical protein
MFKYIAAGLAAFVLLLAGIALTPSQGVQAGFPDCFNLLDDDGDTLIDSNDPECAGITATPSPSPSASPSPSPSASPSPSPTGTAAATGTGTATPTRSPTPVQPAAAPQTGGEPGDGSDTLLLTLIMGAAAIIGVGGVFAGKHALDRRS